MGFCVGLSICLERQKEPEARIEAYQGGIFTTSDVIEGLMSGVGGLVGTRQG